MIFELFLILGSINSAAAQKGGKPTDPIVDGSSDALQLMSLYVTAMNNKNIEELRGILSSDYELTSGATYDYNQFFDLINNIEVATIPTLNFTLLPKAVKQGNQIEFEVRVDDLYDVEFTAIFVENQFRITSETGKGNPYNVPYLMNMQQLARLIATKVIDRYESTSHQIQFHSISEPYTLIYCDKERENVTREMFFRKEKSKNITIVDEKYTNINYITYLPNGEFSFLYQISENVSKVMRGKKERGKHVLESEEIMLTCESEILRDEYYKPMKEWAIRFANTYCEELIEEDFEFINLQNQVFNKTQFIDEFLFGNFSMTRGSFYSPRYHLNDFVLYFQQDTTLNDFEMRIHFGSDDDDEGKLRRMKQLANPEKINYIKTAELKF